MRVLRSLAVVAALSMTACGETAPTITSLDVTSGPPHTLVMIAGSNLDGAEVVWDPGTADEKVIPGGYPSPDALMFSVPPNALAKVHQVKARNSKGESAVLSFTVTAPNPPTASFPKPRIDSVTLVGASFDGAGNVTLGLYVQGANFDVGALVLIDGVEVATYSHKGLRNDLLDVSRDDLEYPITHFVSTVALTGARSTIPPTGKTAPPPLVIIVRNLDMAMSDPLSYPLPTSAADLDSDGDGLSDVWETDGFARVDLKRFGADPYRKDVLVQLDVMPTATETTQGLQHALDPASLTAAQAMFNAAPFLNPTGPPGINLILDTSHVMPYAVYVCFDITAAVECAKSLDTGTVLYSQLKSDHFDNAHRDKIFHYGIWAHTSSDPPGRSDWGDDFLIAFDTWGTDDDPDPEHKSSLHSVRSQVEELTHELGHDLGLFHGAIDNSKYLPNRWSVMSYTWDTRTGFSDSFRSEHASCLPFYYHQSGATETGGHPPMDPGTVTDYSLGMARTLKPPTTEGAMVSVCGKDVMWDADGNTGSIVDKPDWPRLVFTGPATNGWLVP